MVDAGVPYVRLQRRPLFDSLLGETAAGPWEELEPDKVVRGELKDCLPGSSVPEGVEVILRDGDVRARLEQLGVGRCEWNGHRGFAAQTEASSEWAHVRREVKEFLQAQAVLDKLVLAALYADDLEVQSGVRETLKSVVALVRSKKKSPLDALDRDRGWSRAKALERDLVTVLTEAKTALRPHAVNAGSGAAAERNEKLRHVEQVNRLLVEGHRLEPVMTLRDLERLVRRRSRSSPGQGTSPEKQLTPKQLARMLALRLIPGTSPDSLRRDELPRRRGKAAGGTRTSQAVG